MASSKGAYLGALAWALGAGAAAAQGAAPGPEVEELVVTAKGRAEKIEDVALSVAAVSADQLQRQQIGDLRDLAGAVPSLVFEASRGRASPSTLAIRGLSPNSTNKQAQAVSVFLDGVYLGGSASVLDFPELAGIEVLRGPQATQFGRQTYAGAINYRTRTATPERLEGKAEAVLGGNDDAKQNNHEVSLTLAAPLVADRLWLSLYAKDKRLGALGTRTNAVRTIDVDRQESRTFMGALYYAPNDSFSAKLTAMSQRDRDTAPLFVTLQVQEWLADGTPTTTRGPVYWPNGTLRARLSPAYVGCESAAGSPLTCGQTRDVDFVSLVADKEFDGGYTLTYRGGYLEETGANNQDLYFRQTSDPFFGDQPYSRRASATATSASKLANPFFSATSDAFVSMSHELRLMSPQGADLRWKLGAFYYRERLSSFAALNVSPTNPQGRARGDEEVRNLAVFGSVAYDFAPAWTLEAEGRYEREENIFGTCTSCLNAASGGYKTGEQTEAKTRFLPRVTVSFEPYGGALLYGLYSEGTKPGRWNQTIATAFRYVGPERNRNYELGFKSRLWDGRAFVSAAAFYMSVEDQQFSATSTAGGAATSFVQNIGESRIQGFELEGNVQPFAGFNLRGGVAYADQQYTTGVTPDDANLKVLFGADTFKGKTSIGVPKWSGSAGADYGWSPFGLAALVGANVTYTGMRFGDSANLAKLSPLWKLNLNAQVGDGAWLLRGFVRDLLDTDKVTSAAASATNSCLYLRSGGSFSLQPEQRCLAVGFGRGREVGLGVSYKF